MPNSIIPPEGQPLRYDNQTGEPVLVGANSSADSSAPKPFPSYGIPDDAVDGGKPLYPDSVCAGFLRRLLAFAVDWTLIGAFLGVFALIAALSPLGKLGFFSERIFFTYTAAAILWAILSSLYFVLFTKLCAATPGKRLLRLHVVSAENEPLSWFTVIYRETVGRYLTSLLFVGYLVLAVDRQHRGFHDMLADTRVIFD